MHLAVGIEDLPLLDHSADLVVCRNALDHMPNPAKGLQQIWRILKPDGVFFVSVDIGGLPTPDEPTVFSVESLAALLRDQFEIITQTYHHPPHSRGRDNSVRLLARKRFQTPSTIDKEQILQAYMARVEQGEETPRASVYDL